jgi:hypothetical protein
LQDTFEDDEKDMIERKKILEIWNIDTAEIGRS